MSDKLIVSFAAVFRHVTQRPPPPPPPHKQRERNVRNVVRKKAAVCGEELRDEPKNGCEGD